MAIALVQTKKGNAGGYNNTNSQAFASNNAAGNFILLKITAGAADTIASVVDTRGNTYTLIGSAVEAGERKTWAYYAKNIPAGANTITVTFGAGQFPDSVIIAREYSGVHLTAPIRGWIGAGNGNWLQSHSSGATAETAQIGDLVAGLIGSSGSADPVFAAGSGYGNLTQQNGFDAFTYGAAEDKTVASAATQTATFTSSGFVKSETLAVIIIPAASLTTVSITKQLKYTVKRAPSAITKQMRYAIGRFVRSITKSMKYTVKIPKPAITKQLKYNIKLPTVNITKQFKYVIKSSPAITKQLKYIVKAPKSITKQLKYTVKKTPTAITKQFKYQIRTIPTAITKQLRYVLAGHPLLTKQLKYTVKRAVGPTIADSYSETNVDSYLSLGASFVRFVAGQSFTGVAGTLHSVRLLLRKVGAPPGNFNIRVYAHAGTFGTDSAPTGAFLASFTVAASTLSTTATLENFIMDAVNRIGLVAGTKYVVTVEYGNGDASNYIEVGRDTSSPTHAGNAYTATSGVPAYTGDMIFQVLVDTPNLIKQLRYAIRTVRPVKANLYFDAQTSVVTAPHSFPTNAFTVSFKYRAQRTMNNNEALLYKTGGLTVVKQGTNDVQVYAYLDASGDFAGPRMLRIGRSMANVTPDNQWHERTYVIFVDTDNKGTVREFEDGVFLKQSKTDYTGDTSTPTGNLEIGNHFTTSGFNGNLKDVKIIHAKLTDVQVADMIAGTYAPTLNKYLKMDEGEGTLIKDYGTGAQDGTASGTYEWQLDAGVATAKQMRYAIRSTNRRMNMIDNPSFEVDLTGWNAYNQSTRTRDTSESKFGAASMKIVTSGVAGNSALQGTSKTQTIRGINKWFTFSYWIKGTPGDTVLCYLSFVGNGTGDTQAQFTLTGAWQRVQVTKQLQIPQTTCWCYVMVQNANTAVRTVYIDGMQLEEDTQTPSDYIDGDQPGSVWVGTAHASVSRNQLLQKQLRYIMKFATAITKSLIYRVRNKTYTRGTVAALPTADANLGTAYTEAEENNVGSDDGVRVGCNATNLNDYVIHQFKRRMGIPAVNSLRVTWNGKTNLPTATRPVVLQVYNYFTAAWETLDQTTTAAINTDFTLTGLISSNLANYFNAENEITARVYQRNS